MSLVTSTLSPPAVSGHRGKLGGTAVTAAKDQD